MKKLLRFGSPGGLEFFLNLLAFNLLILMFQSYGPAVAVSITIAFNWDMVSFIPLLGVNIAITSLVGRFMGASKPEIADRSIFSGLKITTIYGFFMIIFFVIFPKLFVSLFLPFTENAQNIAPLAEYMVRMVAFYLIADGIYLVFSGALRGAGDTFWTMLISVIVHWLLASEAFLLVKVLKIDPKLTWTFFVFTIPFIALAFFLRYLTGNWRKIKVVN
jgi:MATE family multidrug resistance protein